MARFTWSGGLTLRMNLAERVTVQDGVPLFVTDRHARKVLIEIATLMISFCHLL
jgi:hypothetical protein